MVSSAPTVAGSVGPLGAPSISCRSVCAGYLGSEVLKDISFEITSPSVYVVLGPNGAGKTTLFRTIAGILVPSRGEVVIGGAPGHHQTARDRMHYLSHLDGLPEGFTVREALAFYARAVLATEADIDRVLDKLQIRDLSARFLGQLSAGQKKRVSIARVFLRERDIYLLDEPTANLDPRMAREIRALILELSHDKVVLYSSHNLYEAREIGRYVIVIKEGRLAVFDRIENLRASKFPARRSVAESFGLAGRVAEGGRVFREGACWARGGRGCPARPGCSRGEATRDARDGQSPRGPLQVTRMSSAFSSATETVPARRSARRRAASEGSSIAPPEPSIEVRAGTGGGETVHRALASRSGPTRIEAPMGERLPGPTAAWQSPVIPGRFLSSN